MPFEDDPLFQARLLEAKKRTPDELQLPDFDDDFIDELSRKMKLRILESPDRLDLYLMELKPEGRLGRTLTEEERNRLTGFLQSNIRNIYKTLE